MSDDTYTEQDYSDALQDVIASLIFFLQVGDTLGKGQGQMMGEFMSAFNKATAEVEA